VGTTLASLSAPLRLEPLAGPEIARIKIEPGRTVVLGRSAGADVQLPDSAVSRKHASIASRGTRWLITDLGSRNGAFLNGAPVKPNEPTPLQQNDRLRIGPWSFAVAVEQHPTTGTLTTITPAAGAEGSRVERISPDPATTLARRQLDALLNCAQQLGTASEERALAEAALAAMIDGGGAPRAAVIRDLGGDDAFEVIAVRTQSGHDDPNSLLFSSSLLREAATGQTVQLVGDQLPAHGQSIISLGIRSAVCAPIIVDERVMAYLYIDARGEDRALSNEVGAFCEALARLCGLSMANLQRRALEERRRLLESELDAAREAQQLLMPPESGGLGAAIYALHYRAGRFVAGDLFDIVELPDGRISLFLGDVAGKGVGAAILMTATQTSLRSALFRYGDLSVALAEVNRLIARISAENQFVTVWAGILDPSSGRLSFVDAGHGHWIVIGADGSAKAPGHEGSLVLGVSPNEAFETETVEFGSGSRLVLFSDGLVEQANDEGQQFGRQRAIDALHGSTSPEEDVRQLIEAVEAFCGGGALTDDTTIASVELPHRRGPGA